MTLNGRKKNNTAHREVKYQLAGWILFILCALFFIASSLKNRDTLALIGSLVFLVACLFFIFPLVRPANDTPGRTEKDSEA